MVVTSAVAVAIARDFPLHGRCAVYVWWSDKSSRVCWNVSLGGRECSLVGSDQPNNRIVQCRVDLLGKMLQLAI